MIELLKDLAESGVIGLVAVIALRWAMRMYQDMQKMQKAHQQAMEALRERLITKAETWMEKYHELAKAQNELLDAIERRYGR
jgi:hypothetical protein